MVTTSLSITTQSANNSDTLPSEIHYSELDGTPMNESDRACEVLLLIRV